MLAFALSSRRGVIKGRANSHRNIVVVDMSSRERLEELLGVCGISGSARIPADRGYSTGYLHGVEGDLADHELLQCIESSVTVVCAVRCGKAVTLRFASPVPTKQAAFGAPRPAPTPAGQQASARSASPSADSNASPVTLAVPQLRDDPRDAIFASQQLTLPAVGKLLPSDSPLKVICLQASGLQKTSGHRG
ncbi:hypothetical protein MRX96_017778 [Rhipicephalus microplus]